MPIHPCPEAGPLGKGKVRKRLIKHCGGVRTAFEHRAVSTHHFFWHYGRDGCIVTCIFKGNDQWYKSSRAGPQVELQVKSGRVARRYKAQLCV